jgi:hypothetical protein
MIDANEKCKQSLFKDLTNDIAVFDTGQTTHERGRSSESKTLDVFVRRMLDDVGRAAFLRNIDGRRDTAPRGKIAVATKECIHGVNER